MVIRNDMERTINEYKIFVYNKMSNMIHVVSCNEKHIFAYNKRSNMKHMFKP